MKNTSAPAQLLYPSREFPWIGVVLGLLLLGSALAVTILSYYNRALYREWLHLHAESASLQREWSQILLEQSAWLGEAHIEQLARDELDMIVPRGDKITALQFSEQREMP